MKQRIVQKGHYNFIPRADSSLDVIENDTRLTLAMDDRQSTYLLHEIDDSDPDEIVYFIGEAVEEENGGFPVPPIQQVLGSLMTQWRDARMGSPSWAEGSDHLEQLGFLRRGLRQRGIKPVR